MFLILQAVLAREGMKVRIRVGKTLTPIFCASPRIIVLMLFRLKMTIEDAIRAYVDLSIYVSAEKRRWPLEDSIFHSNRLETAIVSIIQSASNVKQPRELRMLNKGGPKWCVVVGPSFFVKFILGLLVSFVLCQHET